MLSAEIIAIGSELLTPDKTDTNSLWLTQKLNEIGIEVKLKTVVGDDQMRLEETIRDAVKRSNVVVTTGGLGPTEDDITRRISAKALDRELIFKPALVEELKDKFRAFGKKMPERNKQQAFVIDGADVLPNPRGSAVGMYLASADKVFVVLPGPPRELKPMFEDFVLPRLSESAGEIIVRRRSLKVTGMGESAVDELIAPIYTRYDNPQTATLFNKSEIEIQFTAQATSNAEADRLIDEVADQVAAKLGIAVFSTDGEKMEEVVGRMLRARSESLSVAESCTGGLIAYRLTEVPGSSDYFHDGAVTYSNDSKIRNLKVDEALIEKHGAVSEEVAGAMAEGIRRRANTVYGLSVSGIAGPGGGSDEKPVGTVFIGYSDDEETSARKFIMPGDRYLIRWRTSQTALDLLRRKIMGKISER